MKSLRKWVLVPVLLLALIGCFAGCASDISEDRLTEQEILDLREQYPFCHIGSSDFMCASGNVTPAETYIGWADTFVYGEISGEEQRFVKNISSGDIELDQKREANGLSNDYEFYAYKFVVLDDSEGIYEKGAKIYIAANLMLKADNPEFKDGMKFVVPIFPEDNAPDVFTFGQGGVFYVTDDGYVINAYEGADETQAGTSYSGMKVEALLKELKAK